MNWEESVTSKDFNEKKAYNEGYDDAIAYITSKTWNHKSEYPFNGQPIITMSNGRITLGTYPSGTDEDHYDYWLPYDI